MEITKISYRQKMPTQDEEDTLLQMMMQSSGRDDHLFTPPER